MTIPLAVAATFCWILLLPFAGAAWVWVLDLVRAPLGMATNTTALHYVVWDRLAVILPRLDLPSAEPTSQHLMASGLVCVVLVVISYLLPSKMAPTNYFLRAGAFIQGTAVAFFAIKPWPFPYTAGDYLTGLTGAGMTVIGFVPLILAMTHWLLDYRWYQKVGLLVAIMGYLFVMVPFKYAAHGVILYWGGLLYMPVLFILFGLPVEVFAFIALFSWGMSWEQRPGRATAVRSRGFAVAAVIAALMVMGVAPLSDGTPTDFVATDTFTYRITDNDEGSDTATVTVTIAAVIDLMLSSSVDNATPAVGTNVVFTVTLTEESGTNATSVVVDASLASGLSYVSATASHGSYASGTGEWSIGALGGSATATLTLTTRVDSFDPVSQPFEVKSHDLNDVDSTPNNGSTTEDDDDAESLAPSPIGGQICYVVADSGDTLLRTIRNGSTEQSVGATGTVKMEATAYWPGTNVLYGTDAGTFGTLNTTTGAFTSVGSIGTASGSEGDVNLNDVDGLAFDPLTGILWATHRRGGAPNPDDLLFQINPATGAFIPDAFGTGADYVVIDATAVTGRRDIDDLAIDPDDGTLFAINNSGSGGDHLITIDRATGAVTDIGLLGQDDMEGLSFDAYGSLYGSTGVNSGSNSNSFFTVNKTTGVATQVRSLTTGTDHEAVSCLVDGTNTITGSVFLDINANGVWDSGTDIGESGITVELYRDANSDGMVDGGDTRVATSDTDGSGNYSFEVAATAEFVLQIDTGDLPGDATMTTDNVETAGFSGFGNSDSANRFGFKRPIDLSLTVTVDEPSPDVNDNVVFTVILSNDGPSDATGVAVTNHLPGTVTFVSATPSQGSFDSGSGIWSVGSLANTNSASLAVTATVDTEDAATDWAEATAADQDDTDSTPDNNIPSEDDQDDATITPTGGSGGGGGGLESDGTLAGKLARVLFSRRIEAAETGGISDLPRFQFDQGGLAGKATGSSAILRSVVPTEGPADSYPFESSPMDLLPVTNAADVVAADFLRRRDDRRIGAVFGTLTTSGTLYEHTKVVCDRLRGAELVSIRRMEAAGKSFLLSRLVHEDGAIDHAVSFVAYRSGDGFVVDSRFRLDEHVVPEGAEEVINVQIWSVSEEYTRSLLEASLNRLAENGPLTFLNDQADPPRMPDIFVRSGHYSEGTLHLSLQNNARIDRIQLTGGTLQRTELGQRTDFQLSVSVPPPDKSGVSQVRVPVGPVFDAAFFVESDSGDRDVVYLADGAWSYTYDGQGADVSGFDVEVEDGAPKSGTHRVERSVRMQGQVTTWAVLFRYLRANGRPMDLSAYSYLEFTAFGEGQLRVLFEKESVHTSDHFGTVVKLEPEPKGYRLWFDDLRRPDGTGRLDASDLLLISFYAIGQQGRSTDFDMQIGELRFGGAEGDPLAVTPELYELKQNFPNPFNPTTRIAFGMPESGPVRLEVYDALGRSVGTLVNGFLEAGRHEVPFDASHLSSGVYLYRLEAGGRTLVKHMTLLR